MKIKDTYYRSVWLHPQHEKIVQIIDQKFLPHEFRIADLKTVDDVVFAIQEMQVRGAPLIGATAAWGMYLSSFEMPGNCERDFYFEAVYSKLIQARPTAVNLRWALDEMLKSITGNDSLEESRWYAKTRAQFLCDADVQTNKKIGEYGVTLIEETWEKKNDVVNILTHCNAGWLATVDWGTVTAPIYLAQEKNIPVHVWVSETRPRNQGANITAWELSQQGVSHTVIADNAAGHLLQNQKVDLVMVGTDRTSINGDVCNKIGTYMKALAAYDNHVPFYVAAPSSSIDFLMEDAFTELEIEQRNAGEVKYVKGLCDGKLQQVLITPENSPAINYAFDITPARYVSGLITERGICEANKTGILELFPRK